MKAEMNDIQPAPVGFGIGSDRGPSRFQPGQTVRVRDDLFPIGHYRSPHYVRGKTGTIERILPYFLNPEEEGYGKNAGMTQRLYRVRFSQFDLWADYSGKERDVLEIEIFEPWLTEA